MVEINEKQIFSIIQKAKESGLVKFGANEVTKNIERGQSKLVVVATDVSPVEIIAHFEPLCKELKILYVKIGTRAELGVSVGIKSTTAISVNDGGSAKAELDALIKEFKEDTSKKEETTSKKEESKE